MESLCPICKKPYDGFVCSRCTVRDLDVSGLTNSEGLLVARQEKENEIATAFLVDLVSNRKIPISTPRCKVGRDDLNDIVISGDQSISRFHFVITKEDGQYLVQDDKSRHGTFLNGNQISAPEPINDGDVLKVGVSLFWFVIENAATNAQANKQEPISTQAVEAELQFAAPEPSSNRLAASATQTNLRPAGSASATGDFLTIDLSEGEALTSSSARDAGNHPQAELESRRKDLIAFLPKNQNVQQVEKNASRESSAKALDNAEIRAERDNQGNLASFEPLTGGPSANLSSSTSLPDNENAKNVESEHNNFGNLFETDASAEPGFTGALVNLSPTSEIEAKDQSERLEEIKDKDSAISMPEAIPSESVTDHANDSKKHTKNEDGDKASTLIKLAEAVIDVVSPNALVSSRDDNVLSQVTIEPYAARSSGSDHLGSDNLGDGQNLSSDKTTGNGARSLMSTTNESQSATVPDWCNRYFFGELSRLGKELTELNEQVRQAEQKIKEVEGRAALTKSLRNNLLTATGDELVDGCGRVLRLLGWKVKTSGDDKNELRVEIDDKHTCIARVVWTETQADRTHLGQLSISQTRYWCEQGVEPKGILIISRVGENGPPALTASDLSSELADYASKKNVCLMTTLQLLAVFKEIALNDGNADSARSAIMTSNGWLPGFNLEPNDQEKGEGARLSSLLSA